MAEPTSYYNTLITGTYGTNLQGYWPLNEASGTTCNDYSGNSNNGTYGASVSLGNTSLMLGAPEKCVYLDGTTAGGRVSFSATGTGFNGGSQQTWIAWVNPASNEGLGYLIFKSGQYNISIPNSTDYYALTSSFTNTSSVTKTATSYSGTIVMNGGGHMIVSVYDGAHITLYLNGISQGSVSATGTMKANTGNGIYFGTPSGTNGVIGYMQHTALFNTALTQANIRDLYVAGIQGQYPIALQTSSYVFPWSINVCTANASRKRVTLTNDSQFIMWISLGSTAVAGQGIPLMPFGGIQIIEDYTGVISAIIDSPIGLAHNLCILEE